MIEDDQLRGVELGDKRLIEIDALFVPPRFVPNNDLLVELGCELDDDGWAITDATGRTSVAGVWAAGNLTNPRAQVITAAGEGSAAAIALTQIWSATTSRRRLSRGERRSRPQTRKTQPDAGGVPMEHHHRQRRRVSARQAPESGSPA